MLARTSGSEAMAVAFQIIWHTSVLIIWLTDWGQG
jgi:hypothetical protein